mgnify:CR=1 FL=1
MTPIQIAAMRAHALTAAYRRRLADLHDLVAGIDPETSYVSFSAGKDSAVIAHACHAAHPGMPILMIDPGCPTHWTEQEREEWKNYAKRHGWNLTLYEWDKWGLDLETDDVADYQQRIHRDMFSAIHAHAEASGLTTRIMGLRAAESRNRRMSIGRRGAVYDYKDGGRAVLPIATWQTADVWAYIVSTGMPWLDIYDKLGPNARNGLVGRSGDNFGRVEYLKQHYPDVWRWAVERKII